MMIRNIAGVDTMFTFFSLTKTTLLNMEPTLTNDALPLLRLGQPMNMMPEIPHELPECERIMYLVHGFIRKECQQYRLNIPYELISLFYKWCYDNELSYRQLLDILLNRECCIGIYDFKLKIWRPAIYICHGEVSKSILCKFTDVDKHIDGDEIAANPNYNSLLKSVLHDQFITFHRYPIDFVVEDGSRFRTSEQELKCYSSLPKEKLDAWITRKLIK